MKIGFDLDGTLVQAHGRDDWKPSSAVIDLFRQCVDQCYTFIITGWPECETVQEQDDAHRTKFKQLVDAGFEDAIKGKVLLYIAFGKTPEDRAKRKAQIAKMLELDLFIDDQEDHSVEVRKVCPVLVVGDGRCER